MKQLCLILCFVAGAAAAADPMADAMKAWEQRDFVKSRQMFTELAKGGNAQAQLMLGEMLGFGEGGAEDPVAADSWLAKAGEAGVADAAASRIQVRERARRHGEIERYAGTPRAVPTLAGYGCVLPVLPEESRTQKEIKAVNEQLLTWRECYARFGTYLQAESKATGVPKDVEPLMNVDELSRARTASQQAIAAAIELANRDAQQFAVATDGWFQRTQAYTTSMEKEKRDSSDRRQRELEDVTSRYRAVIQAPRK